MGAVCFFGSAALPGAAAETCAAAYAADERAEEERADCARGDGVRSCVSKRSNAYAVESLYPVIFLLPFSVL